MALDVYFREDILNVLRSTFVASEGSFTLVTQLLEDPDFQNVPIQKLINIYRQGVITALGSVGIAFGLDAPEHGCGTRVSRSLVDVPEPASFSGSSAVHPNRIASQNDSSELQVFSFLWAGVRRTREQC